MQGGGQFWPQGWDHLPLWLDTAWVPWKVPSLANCLVCLQSTLEKCLLRCCRVCAWMHSVLECLPVDDVHTGHHPPPWLPPSSTDVWWPLLKAHFPRLLTDATSLAAHTVWGHVPFPSSKGQLVCAVSIPDYPLHVPRAMFPGSPAQPGPMVSGWLTGHHGDSPTKPMGLSFSINLGCWGERQIWVGVLFRSEVVYFPQNGAHLMSQSLGWHI